MSRIERRDFSSELMRIDTTRIPARVQATLERAGIAPAELQRIANDDHVISGAAEFERLYDRLAELDRRDAGSGRADGGARLDRAGAVYAALVEAARASGAPTRAGTEAPARTTVGVGRAARREVALDDEPRDARADAAPAAPTTAQAPDATPATPAAPPPPVPEGYEHRTRRVGRRDVRTHTEVAPADLLRAAQIAALPPATTSGRASVGSYLDAIAARDRQVQLHAEGDRVGASHVRRPATVNEQQWALTQALRQEGISTRDVESYLATGQLPDLLDEQNQLVMSGEDRMHRLEREATQQGSWTATNTFTFLIGARRSALAAERQAMQARAATLPADEPLRADIQAAITASESLDQDLGRSLQGIYRARTYSAEHVGQSLIRRASTLETQAASDPARRAELLQQAQSLRDRGAVLAAAEGDYRASIRAYDASSAYRLAARAQIETGTRVVEAAREPGGALPAQLPAELGDGDRTTTTNGVAGAGHLLQSAATHSTDRGRNHEQLGLHTARQGAIASYHQIAVERSGYDARVGANGAPVPARTEAAVGHRQAYLDARAEQSRLLMERIGLYAPLPALSAADAEAVAQLQVQRAGILQEFGASLGTSLATDRQVTEQRQAVSQLEEGAVDARKAATDAERQAVEQRSTSTEQRDSARALTRVTQTSGQVRRDEQLTRDADTAEAITDGQAAVATANRGAAERALADGRDQLRGLELQQRRDRQDAELVRNAMLTHMGADGRSTTVRGAYDRTRTLGDRSARDGAAALDRAEAARDPSAPIDTRSIADVARARLDLARYWTGTTEVHREALGAPGRAGATERLDTAVTLVDAASHGRSALPVDAPERVALASGEVRERSALAVANADYRPGASRDQLARAEAVANADLGDDAARLGEARSIIGTSSVQSVLRHNARVEELVIAGNHDDLADDQMYAQARRLLARTDLPDSKTTRMGRELVGRVEAAFDALPRMYRDSRQQLANGVNLSGAQVGAMSYAEGVAESAKMSSLITGSVWLMSEIIPGRVVDMKDEVQTTAEANANTGRNQQVGFVNEQMRGAEDLARGFEHARAGGRAFQYVNAVRIWQVALEDQRIPRAQFDRQRDFIRGQLPPERQGSRDMFAFASVAFRDGPTGSGGVPVVRATRGALLGYVEAERTLGDPRIAVVTSHQQMMLGVASGRLKSSTENLGWYVATNALGEIAVGLIVTGGVGSVAAVGEAAEAANTVRTGLQAASTARTLTTLGRVGQAVFAVRTAAPTLYTAGVAATMGTTMGLANYGAQRVFGRNSAGAAFTQVAGNFIPLGASSHAAGLASAGRRAALVGEEGLLATSRGVSWAAIREGLGFSSLVAHGRFYGPQFAMAGIGVAATTAGVPWVARKAGLERSELAQQAMGVLVNTLVAGGFAYGAGALGRRAQSTAAAERLIQHLNAVGGGGEVPQSTRARMQTAAAREIEAFQSTTQGRMPTRDEASALRAGLSERLGIDARTPEGQRQLAALDGAVEALRATRAGELGLAQAINEQRTGDGARTRDRVGALLTPDELSPSRPPTRELSRRAVELAAEQLYAARGGEAEGASYTQAQRDAAEQLAVTFRSLARAEVEAHGDTAYARALMAAEAQAGDRATAAQLTAQLGSTGARGEPPMIGPREARRVEPILTEELTRAREALDARATGDLRAQWTAARERLVREGGVSEAAADAALRGLQGEIFDQGVARRLVATQAAADHPLSNAEVGVTARDLARRMGFSAEAQEVLARDVVSARSRLEQAGILRPGGATVAEQAVATFRAEHPEAASRLEALDADAFVRAFGEQPNRPRLAELAAVPGFAELAAHEPARARALVDAPAALDVAGLATRHGVAGAELYLESPAALHALVRAEGEAGATRALATDPAAARARGAELARAHAARVDGSGAVGLEVLSGARSAELLSSARFPARSPGAESRPLDAAQLARMGLEPRYEVTVDGTRMGLSEPFELGAGRRGVVAYIAGEGGEVHAQIFYRSNSQSAWRTSDASFRGHFGKGLGEIDTALPLDLTVALHRMANEGPAQLRAPETRAVPEPIEGRNPMADVIFRGLTVEVTAGAIQSGAIEMHGPHYFSSAYAAGRTTRSLGAHGAELATHNPELHVPDPRQIQLPSPDQIPDFTARPEASFQFQSDAYAGLTGDGTLTGHVYRSRDGSLRYLVVEDAAGRASIVGAERVGSPVTRWGNRREAVDLHGMDAPLFEYGRQRARSFGGDDTAEYRMNWSYVRETPMVRELYRQRGVEPPPAVPETARALADPALRVTVEQMPSYERRAASALLHPAEDVGVPADVAGRARENMAAFVRQNGEEGARYLVRVAERRGVRELFERFARDPAAVESGWRSDPVRARGVAPTGSAEVNAGSPVPVGDPFAVRDTRGWSGTPTSTPRAGQEHLAVIERGQRRMSPAVRQRIDAYLERAETPSPALTARREALSREQEALWTRENQRLANTEPSRLSAAERTQLEAVLVRQEELSAQRVQVDEQINRERDTARASALAEMRRYRENLMRVDDETAAGLAGRVRVERSALEGPNGDRVRGWAADFYRLTGQRPAPEAIRMVYDRPRAEARRSGDVNVGKEPSRELIFHELGHQLEYTNPEIGRAAEAWVLARSRFANENATPRTSLRELTGSDFYGREEVAYEDHFVDPYVGKWYADGTTEVVSSGMESFTSHEGMLDLYRRDPEHFFFMMGVLSR